MTEGVEFDVEMNRLIPDGDAPQEGAEMALANLRLANVGKLSTVLDDGLQLTG
jgi:hypothetical protein